MTLADLFVPLLRTPSELLYHWGNLTIVYLVGHGLRVSADRAAREAVRAHEAESRVRERELAAIAELPDEEWDTVAGLMLDLLGRMPEPGEDVTFRGLTLKADKVQGRRIASVLITRAPEENSEGSEVAGV